MEKSLNDVIAELSIDDLRAMVLRNAEADRKKAAQRKRYMQAHKEERKLYSQKRQARIKALLQRAKELGLDAPQDEGDGAEG